MTSLRSPHSNASNALIANIPPPVHPKFNKSFCEMIKDVAVISRVDWLLFRYRIKDEVEVSEIISEAYLRAIKSLAAGTNITNLHGWFRATAHNIVREKFRARETGGKLTEKLIREYDGKSLEKNLVSCTINDPRFDQLWSRLERLNPIERKILIWQSQGMSLGQITAQLIQDGDCPDSEPTANITKRASRARKKLREGD
jgi:DNA-directed RNA polymerase specialized sigma24 family protein